MSPFVTIAAPLPGHERPTAAFVRLLVCALLAVSPPARAFAQARTADPARVTLAALVERALERHPSVGAQRAAYDEARRAAGVVAASRFPRVEAAASATQYQEPMLVQPLHGLSAADPARFDETLVQSGVTLGYTLFDGGARGARIRQARSRAGAAQASLDEGRATLIRQTAGAYVAVIASRQVLDAHEARVRALEAERERVGQVQAVGRAARVDLLRVQAALSNARAEWVRAAAALDVAVRDLARLTGSTVEEVSPARLAPLTLADSLLPARDAQLAAARWASPSAGRARAQLGAAEAGVAVARGARWPEVRLLATEIGRGSGADPMKGEWSAGGVVSVPLFTGGATTNEIARAEAARRTAAEQLRLAELQVAQELDRTRADVAEADARAASLRDAAEQFAEVARIERLSLQAGAGTQTDYLGAEADLLAARAGFAQAQAARMSARVELARVAGELSPNWLQRTLEVVP